MTTELDPQESVFRKAVGVEVRGGVIVAKRLYARPYRASDKPNLPNVFARIVAGGEKAAEERAVEFVRRYGPIGYVSLWVREHKTPWPAEVPKGDPLAWVLGQARSVRFCARLIESLSNLDARGVVRVLRENLVERSVTELGIQSDDPEVKEQVFSWIEGIKRTDQFVWLGRAANAREKVFAMARQLIVAMVNGNTQGVRPRALRIAPSGRLEPAVVAPTLIENIWWKLGEWALTAEARGERGLVRLCKECGTPFLVTDRRQEFCPGPPGQGSTCGYRYRKRRLRARQKGSGTDGQAEEGEEGPE